MIVASIDQRDVDGRRLQRPGRAQAAEPASDDDDSMPLGHRPAVFDVANAG